MLILFSAQVNEKFKKKKREVKTEEEKKIFFCCFQNIMEDTSENFSLRKILKKNCVLIAIFIMSN